MNRFEMCPGEHPDHAVVSWLLCNQSTRPTSISLDEVVHRSRHQRTPEHARISARARLITRTMSTAWIYIRSAMYKVYRRQTSGVSTAESGAQGAAMTVAFKIITCENCGNVVIRRSKCWCLLKRNRATQKIARAFCAFQRRFYCLLTLTTPLTAVDSRVDCIQ